MARILITALLALFMLSGNAGAFSEVARHKKGVRAYSPSQSEILALWQQGAVVLDRTVPGTEIRVVCALLGTLGEDCYLGLRVSERGKIRQMLYFISDDWNHPVLTDGEHEAHVLMPSGDELLIIPKKPNQSSEPTPTAVTTPAAQEIAPAAVVAHL